MKLSLRLVVKITSLVVKPIPLGGDWVLRAEPSGIGQSSYMRNPRASERASRRASNAELQPRGAAAMSPGTEHQAEAGPPRKQSLAMGRSTARAGKPGALGAQPPPSEAAGTALLPPWVWNAGPLCPSGPGVKALAQDLDLRTSNLRATEWNLPKNESYLKSPPHLIQMMFK